MVRATCTTWKFQCTLLENNFWINVYVTRYMEISMDPFGIEFLNYSHCYRVHGNFHGTFWHRMFQLVSMLQGSWKFPCTRLNKNFWIGLNVTRYMEISMDPFGIEFLNKPQWYGLHVLHGYYHVPFWTIIFELISLLQGTWKFPWNVSV